MHRNCLFIHGIKKEKGEDTDSVIKNKINEEMNIEVLPDDIDRSYRIGNPKTKKKERPIIVEVIWYNQRNNIIKNKKFLKIKVFQSRKASQNRKWKH